MVNAQAGVLYKRPHVFLVHVRCFHCAHFGSSGMIM